MSGRWLFLPVAALVVLAGYLGLRAGMPVSETAIIDSYAARYLADAPEGAAPTDCVARPGEGAVRLTVRCIHASGTVYEYDAGPRGGLLAEREGPQT